MAQRSGAIPAARGLDIPASWRRGKIPKLVWATTSYLLTNFTITLFWLFFHVLNRTTVFGQENVGEEPNTLLLSNHQSMIDSFFVGMKAYYPKSLVKPHLLPWNPAAAENFYKSPILVFLAKHWRCIPVRPGRRDLRALRNMIEVLPTSVMTLFPEGSRSRDGTVGPGKVGAGMLILATRPRVIPVAIDGMDQLLPIGRKIPNLGKRLYVSYGPPLDYSEFLDKPRTRETAQALVDKLMKAIEAQHAELRRLRSSDRRVA